VQSAKNRPNPAGFAISSPKISPYVDVILNAGQATKLNLWFIASIDIDSLALLKFL
jgi:hypothetical protein